MQHLLIGDEGKNLKILELSFYYRRFLIKIYGILLLLLLFSSPIYSQKASRAVTKLLEEEVVVGRQIAVFIAIDKYENLPVLTNPVKDATEIREILTDRYFFDMVEEIYDEDATKANINKLFGALVNETKPSDSVFIFYAGHGLLDENSGLGFWMPVDGGIDRNAQENWLPHSQIKGYISNIKARKVALFVDSCFAGEIIESGRSMQEQIGTEYFRNAYQRISRQVLTSGASETVPDRSEFATQLKMALEGNNKPYLDPLEIYSQIRLGISRTTPLFGNLKDSGHQEGGSFIFFLRDDQLSMVAPQSSTRYKVTEDTGSVKISTYDSGSLYIDGEYVTDIGTDKSKTIHNVAIGENDIEMRFGQNRIKKQIVVEKDAMHELAFTYEANPQFLLKIDPDVPNLLVYVDDLILGKTPFETTLSAGEYQIAIRDQWIDELEFKVTGQGRDEIVLKPEIQEIGKLVINGSFPRGTLIQAGDWAFSTNEQTVGPLSLPLKPGNHSFTIEHPTLRSITREVSIEPRNITQITPGLEFRKGTLKIIESPVWADSILIDGAPFSSENSYVIGTHELTIENPYGAPYRFFADVIEDELTEFEIPTGTLQIEGIPIDATVSLGGEIATSMGSALTPFSYNLLPGKYILDLNADYADKFKARVTVAAGEVVAPEVHLSYYGNIAIDADNVDKPVQFTLRESGLSESMSVRIGVQRIPVGTYDFTASFKDDIAVGLEKSIVVERGALAKIDLSNLQFSPEYRLEDLNSQLVDLSIKKNSIDRSRTILNSGGWISLAVSAVSAIGGVFSYFAGQEAMEEYQVATSSSDVTSARNKIDLFSTLLSVSISVGSTGIVAGPLMWLFSPSDKDLSSQLAKTKAEIGVVRLEMETE